ncbi:glycosyltransferase family protein [Bowmanella dokdonensis]|uniref:Glycosyltransferase family 8 protein n=1 Tax=Bowmanella dokdonensis TaxID=751969 RepID=A0A939ISZ6_9ALTE|nr:glycosyltransferase family 8 protein [Bowmanella dokdonensis]MBN7827684.1 glycosyltransferase family 8 protein [Bowmanella dokdonensis]
MKKAIFTIAVGADNPMYQASIRSFERYAKRVNADLIVSDELHYPIKIDEPKYYANPAWAEKMRIGELLKTYHRVLYLDADILITPNARDVFQHYEDLDTIYMFNEGRYVNRDEPIESISSLLGMISDWSVSGNNPTYYNLGVMLISRQSPLFSLASLEELQAICNKTKFYEQTYINYLIQRHKLKNSNLEEKFNRMDLLGNKGYKQADFIHYANKGFSKSGRRRELQYVIDYLDFFKEEISMADQKNLKKSVWKFYLSRVYARYNYLPRTLLRFLCRTFVKV